MYLKNKRIKKIVLIILLLLINNSYCFSQSDLNFIEIRIASGPSVYGMSSIKLLREGLVCRTYILKNKKQKEIIKFFPFKKLDNEKFIELQNYITTNQIFNIALFDTPDSLILTFQDPIKISFVNLRKNEFSSITYQYCNPIIDKMLILMNDLIPKKYISIFRITPKCNPISFP